MKISISKDEIADMPVVTFPGNIYVVDSMAKMNMAVTALRKEQVVGFDSETRPSFQRGQTHKVALLQISSQNDCFLFRVNKIGIPDKLKSFLEDESIQKIGLSLNDDFHVMHKICDFTPGGFIDLQKMVKEYFIDDMSLQKIYAILFEKKISKAQRLSNWEAKTLTAAQERYAAIDAIACLEIYNYLCAGYFVPEQSPYIVDEDVEENSENSGNEEADEKV